jgi:hypothetical protein
MELDLELDGWRREWQADTAGTIDLTARVERETRRMRYILIGDILITVILGGGTIAWAAVSRRSDLMVLVGGVWTFLAIAWLMSWVLRRGAWTPLAATTAAFLDLSILRCRRRREATYGQCALYVAILSFDLWWIRTYNPPHAAMDVVAFLTTPALLIVWLVTAVLAVVAVLNFRRLGRELEMLVALRDDFEGTRSPHDGRERLTGGRRQGHT